MLNYSIKNKTITDSASKSNLLDKQNVSGKGVGIKRLAFKPSFLQIPHKDYLNDTVVTPKTARVTHNATYQLNSSFSKPTHITPDKIKIKKQLSFVQIKPHQQQKDQQKLQSTTPKETKKKELKFLNGDHSPSFIKNMINKNLVNENVQQTVKLRQTVNTNPLITKTNLPPKPIKTMVQFEVENKQNDKSMRVKIQSEYSSNPKEDVNTNKFVQKNHARNHTCTFEDETPNFALKFKNQYSHQVTPRISQEKLTKSVNVKNNPMNQTDPQGSYFQKIMTKRLSSTNLRQRQKLPSVCLSDFQLGSCKGEGRFGQVFPAKHRKTGLLVAIKKIKKQSVKIMLKQFIQQLKISLFLNHSNVVKMYGFFHDSIHFYIIMEYMEEGSLYKYVKMNKRLQQEEVVTKLIEICQGLSYIHSLDILHRDIKPQNIVLSNGVCKICDFGWAIYSKERRTTYCGTLDYVCPQMLQGESYDNFVDIWAIGVLAYQMLAGKAPFYHISRQQTMRSIMKCNFVFPEEFSRAAKSFIAKSLQKNPDRRLTIQQLLKDSFLKQKLQLE